MISNPSGKSENTSSFNSASNSALYSNSSSLPASRSSSSIRVSTSSSISVVSNETRSSWGSPSAIASKISGDIFSIGSSSNEAILLDVPWDFSGAGIFKTSVSGSFSSSSLSLEISVSTGGFSFGKAVSVDFSAALSVGSFSTGKPVNASASLFSKSLKSLKSSS